jgi:hypothetical protein
MGSTLPPRPSLVERYWNADAHDVPAADARDLGERARRAQHPEPVPARVRTWIGSRSC